MDISDIPSSTRCPNTNVPKCALGACSVSCMTACPGLGSVIVDVFIFLSWLMQFFSSEHLFDTRVLCDVFPGGMHAC